MRAERSCVPLPRSERWGFRLVSRTCMRCGTKSASPDGGAVSALLYPPAGYDGSSKKSSGVHKRAREPAARGCLIRVGPCNASPTNAGGCGPAIRLKPVVRQAASCLTAPPTTPPSDAFHLSCTAGFLRPRDDHFGIAAGASARAARIQHAVAADGRETEGRREEGGAPLFAKGETLGDPPSLAARAGLPDNRD